MLDLLVLAPFFFLVLGALAASIMPRLAEPSRRWISIGILTITCAAILLNLIPATHRIDISIWDTAGFSLSLQLDGVALVLLLAVFIPLLALELARPTSSQDSFSYSVLLSGALFVCSANLLTTVCAWALLDLALYAWRTARRIPQDTAMRALILGQLAGLGLFAGTILLDAMQPQTGAFLIAVAFWARLGLFPFHWVAPSEDYNTLELTVVRGVALIAGASAWLRWDELKASVPFEFIALLAALACIAVLVRVASSNEAVDKFAANGAVALVFVPLGTAFGGEAAKALSLSTALGAAFAMAIFELGLIWQSDAQIRWARFFFVGGILSIAGTPLTPSFLGRIGANIALIENGQGLIFLIGTIASIFALVPLWRITWELRGAEAREPKRSEYFGLQILGLAFIVFGFGAEIIGQVTGESVERALDLVLRTDDLFAAGAALLALIATLGISFWAARVKWGYHARAEEIAELAERLMDLHWLARWLTRLGENVSALGRSLSALAEENPTIWILFAALWIAIFLLTTR